MSLLTNVEVLLLEKYIVDLKVIKFFIIYYLLYFSQRKIAFKLNASFFSIFRFSDSGGKTKMKSSLVTFVVGLSLCSASAALLYVWLKTKNNNDDDKNRDKNQKPKLQRQNRTKVECTIENDKVPFVIGRGSHNVNKIEKDTNTKITFREKDENNHICEIVGTYEDILRAERKIKDSIRPTNVTEEFFIPEAAYNAIIGRAGKILQEICRKSMAQVHIDSGVNTSTVATTTKTELNADARRVMIKGTQQNVNAAKSFIDEKVREALKEQENEFKREPRGSPRINQSNAKDNDDLAGEDNIDGNADACQTIMEPDGIKGQLEVYVSAMASIDKFWIQLCGPQSNELDQLVEKMTKYYNETENQEIHRIDDPFLGQIVTTRFQYDSKWYRAEVVGIIPNENNPRCVALDVFFVDYGDNQYVFPHEVFGIGTEFLQLRFQAIECFLANVQPIKPTKESAWSGDAITKFEELTSGNFFFFFW